MFTILRSVATMAESEPDKVALAEGTLLTTYEALDRQSTAMALWLRDEGLVEGNIIAFVKESMTAAYVTMFAGLKAGVGFLVLDHAEDETKLRHMLDLADVRLIVTEGAQAERAVAAAGRSFVGWQTIDWNAVGALPEIDPETIAYIEPTSGSTALPKLVYSSQSVVDHYVAAQAEVAGLTVDDRVAVLGEMWIDTLFAGLAVGARIEAFDFKRYGASALSEWMRDRGVTCVQTYVAAFRALCEATATPLPDLKHVRLSGEGVLRQDVESFETLCLPGSRLTGYFGATECGLVSAYVHTHGASLPDKALPIGKPIVGTSLRVVDPLGQDMPDGGIGALEFRTTHLPGGYLNNADMTAKVYATEPHGVRVLRSGDVGFKDQNGDFHLTGRLDDQVKIRGYSVRYSEVDEVLRAVDGVAEAAVTSIVSPRGVRQLSAHVIVEPETDIGPAEIKEVLNDKLPAYMVPPYVTLQDSLPRTGSGKILRRALPNPIEDLQREEPDWSLLTDTEKRVSEVWKDVLGHWNFSSEEDFFDVGGDSLQAMSVVISLEQSETVRIGYESLVRDGASVAAISDRIERAKASSDGDLVSLLDHGDNRPLYVLPVENGEFSDWLYLLNRFDQTRPVLGVHARPPDQREFFVYRTVDELAAYAADAILRHDPKGPHLIAGFSSGAQLAFEVAVLLKARGVPVAGLMLVDPPVLATEDEYRTWHIRRIFSPLFKRGDIGATLNRAAHIVLRRPARELSIADETCFWRHRPKRTDLSPVIMFSALDENPHKIAKEAVWRDLVGGDIQIEDVSGDHVNIVRDPFAPRLAKLMEAWMDDVTTGMTYGQMAAKKG